MKLTLKQEQLIKKINDKVIKNLYMFIMQETSLEKDKSTHTISGTDFSVRQNEEVYIIKNKDEFILQLYDFVEFCQMLEELKLVKLHNIGNVLAFPNVGEKKDGRFSVSDDVIQFYKENKTTKIIVRPDLQNFIDNNFVTNEEKRYNELSRARDKSEKWTQRIAVISILVSLITAAVGGLFSYIAISSTQEIVIKNSEQNKNVLEVKVK